MLHRVGPGTMTEAPTPLAKDARQGGHAIAARIRRAVALGEIVPGQRLLQRDVAEQYGVSITPVREAFMQLAAQGFIAIDLNRGAVVILRSPEEIRELYEVRKALETLATVKAAEHLTAQDYDVLEQLCEQLSNAGTNEARIEANAAFHNRIHVASGMHYLVSLIDNLRELLSYYVNTLYRDLLGIHEAAEGHHRILDACRAQDEDAIRAAIEDHLEGSAEIAIAVASTRSGRHRESEGRRPADAVAPTQPNTARPGRRSRPLVASRGDSAERSLE